MVATVRAQIARYGSKPGAGSWKGPALVMVRVSPPAASRVVTNIRMPGQRPGSTRRPGSAISTCAAVIFMGGPPCAGWSDRAAVQVFDGRHAGCAVRGKCAVDAAGQVVQFGGDGVG